MRDQHVAGLNRSPKADFDNSDPVWRYRQDGMIVDFGFETRWGKSLLRFDVRHADPVERSGADGATRPPRSGRYTGTTVDQNPVLDGRADSSWIVRYSRSLRSIRRRSISCSAPPSSFEPLIPTGKSLWEREARARPGRSISAVTGGWSSQLISDGTIRWHHPDDGRELLALQVLPDKKNWVLWTPEGFYAATPGAHGVLRWLVNRGPDKAADTVPVRQSRR